MPYPRRNERNHCINPFGQPGNTPYASTFPREKQRNVDDERQDFLQADILKEEKKSMKRAARNQIASGFGHGSIPRSTGFELAMVRNDYAKAAVVPLEELTERAFLSAIQTFFYTSIKSEHWEIRVHCNEDAWRRNDVKILSSKQPVEWRANFFNTIVKPGIKSGEWVYVSLYYPKVIIYYGDTKTDFEFDGPGGSEESWKELAEVCLDRCGVDPLSDPEGIIVCSSDPTVDTTRGRYGFHFWGQELNLEEWRRRVFFQLNSDKMYLFKRGVMGSYLTYEPNDRFPEDAIREITENDERYVRVQSGGARYTVDPDPEALPKRRMLVTPKKASFQKPIYSPSRRRLSDIRAGIKNVKSSLKVFEANRGAFVKQQQKINDEWEHDTQTKIPKRTQESRIPEYASPIYSITVGDKFPSKYPRVMTASEVEDLLGRVVKLENALLKREDFCRVCDMKFAFTTEGIKAHYDEHRYQLRTFSEDPYITVANDEPFMPVVDGDALLVSNTASEDDDQKSWAETLQRTRDSKSPEVRALLSKDLLAAIARAGRKYKKIDRLQRTNTAGLGPIFPITLKAETQSTAQESEETVQPSGPKRNRVTKPATTPKRKLLPPTPESIKSLRSGRLKGKPAALEYSEDNDNDYGDGEYCPSSAPSIGTKTVLPAPGRSITSRKRKASVAAEDLSYSPKPSDPSTESPHSPKYRAWRAAQKPTSKRVTSAPLPSIFPASNTTETRSPKKQKSSRMTAGKLPKGDSVYRPGKEKITDEDILTPEIKDEGPKKKYCPVCWKCVSGFGTGRKLKLHLKHCGTSDDRIVMATRSEALLKREASEVRSNAEVVKRRNGRKILGQGGLKKNATVSRHGEKKSVSFAIQRADALHNV